MRSPVGVPPRLSPGGFRPFRSTPGQASWDAVARRIGWTGVTRPSLSQSRECTSRTGRSTGERDARSCPGADCKSARGHRTRSVFRSASQSRPLHERDSSMFVTERVTNVNENVTIDEMFHLAYPTTIGRVTVRQTRHGEPGLFRFPIFQRRSGLRLR